ncbi:hypothetical protein [Actinophytocola oryzae]|uniref:HK97 gp10 family phage protein n=1 Tax=Actinophytocola oryzae TaxID=502181 RepID=A0A4R7UYG0_9PSEU|nr:hypothetical protein [Actinophytocola oryzae]TDV40116.1 hypothetical protein CLV71_124135 [Actinophytocola oryzae]
MQDFGKVLAQAEQAIRAAMVQGVHESCEDLLSVSRDEIPYDQGDLSNSGLASTESTSTGAHGAVGYDTPYAVVQHEAVDFRHQDGRKAHFLGDPLREYADRYLQHIAGTIGDALS